MDSNRAARTFRLSAIKRAAARDELGLRRNLGWWAVMDSNRAARTFRLSAIK
ncbi:hypothetical protein L599_004100000200, partial [Luteimonas sp. J16]